MSFLSLLLYSLQLNPSTLSRVWRMQRPLMEVKRCLSVPSLVPRAKISAGFLMGNQWKNPLMRRLWHLRVVVVIYFCWKSYVLRTVAQWHSRLAQHQHQPNSPSKVYNEINLRRLNFTSTISMFQDKNLKLLNLTCFHTHICLIRLATGCCKGSGGQSSSSRREGWVLCWAQWAHPCVRNNLVH